MIDTQEYLGELLEMVQDADQAVMDIYGSSDIAVETKSDNTPVTKADIAAHHILTAGLSRLFPHIPIISEEGDELMNREIVKSERFWLVDPLDGTREFLARTGHFTVCLALIEKDAPSFGIVSAPALDVTYYGGPQTGSYRKKSSDDNNDVVAQIHVSDHHLGVTLSSRSDLNKQTAEYIAAHYPDSEIQAVGSQLKLPYIAEGLADVYPRINGPLHLWDLAAGHAILEGAGGTVIKPNGNPVNYHDQNLLVGDFIAKA